MTQRRHYITNAVRIATLTLGSRILGLLRECTYSYFFSTSTLLSAFRIAFALPNLARRLFGEGALSSAMIPVLSESLEEDGEPASRRFVGSLLITVCCVLVAIVLLAEIVIAVWRQYSDDYALRLAAILMPYMLLICLVAIVGGVLNVRQHFSVPAAAPAILNIVIVGATLVAAKLFGAEPATLIIVVCGAVLAAGLAQLILSAAALRAVRFWPDFSRPYDRRRVSQVMRLMAPMVLGLSAVQINASIDYFIAYIFVVHNGEHVGPAVLGYAQYLYQLPLGVFGIALATALFPVISAKAAQNDNAGVAEVFGTGLRLSLFVGLPASVGLMFVARPIVEVVLQRGSFDADDTGRVSSALLFYSIGIAAYFAQHVLVRVFYALKDSRTPARIAASMVLLNFAMNITLVFWLEERGLALATAVCGIIQAAWLARRLGRVLPGIPWASIRDGGLRMLLATAVMAGALAILSQPGFLDLLCGSNAYITLAVEIVIGVAVYAGMAKLLHLGELRSVLRASPDYSPASRRNVVSACEYKAGDRDQARRP